VSDRIRYHFDEHLPNAVAKGLRRHGIDVTMPIDVGLLKARDEMHLAYARRTGRVMVTFDLDYVHLHYANVEHAGIAYIVPRSRSIGYLIEYLLLLYEVYLPDQMINRLEYV
jgi:hypothetical protein